MRFSHLLALAGVVVLVIGVSVVFTDEPLGSAEVVPAPKLSTTPPTSWALVLAAEVPGGADLAQAEDDLTEAAMVRTTTTSSSTTTTTAAPRSTQPTSAAAPTTTADTQPPPSGGPHSSHEGEFRALINSLRASSGLGSLSSNGSLNARARSWAQTMAESGRLMHSNLGSLVPPWSGAGENVGKGGSVSSVFNGLAGSSAHRSNMLGDYTDFGVGVWVDGDGTIWTVHVFTR